MGAVSGVFYCVTILSLSSLRFAFGSLFFAGGVCLTLPERSSGMSCIN